MTSILVLLDVTFFLISTRGRTGKATADEGAGGNPSVVRKKGLEEAELSRHSNPSK